MTTAWQRSAFSSYRAEVARRAKLTPDAERDLAERYRGGDREAARELIEGCLGTVIAIALEYRRHGQPIEDLVQEGNLGLLKAIDRFDPGRGVRLSKYASYWIRAGIREYAARHYRVVRLGSSKAERRALWLYRRTREDRPERLAAMSGLSTERAADLLPLLTAPDASLSPSSDGSPGLLDRLADRERPAEAVLSELEEHAQLGAALAEVLSDLSERDRDIVRQRWLADEPATLEQLGTTWGVSRERVRQIEEGVKKRMRVRLGGIADVPAVPR